MCKPTVISNKGDVTVTECRGCKIVNVWKKGVLMTFSMEQFQAFIRATKDLEFDDYLEYHPDGGEIVILATPFPDVSLAFSRVEWGDFFSAVQEAEYMQYVYQLVHQ